MANTSQSILARLKDMYNNPRDYLEMVNDRMNNTVMGREPVAGPSGAGLRKMSDRARIEQLQQAMLDNSGGAGMGALGVIKIKGGNWLNGSVENALKGLKRHEPMMGEAGRAFNNWIEGPLTKYIKRDMATEGDPVRKLAEQGVLHINPEQLNINMATYSRHPLPGQTFSARSPVAQAWEGASDLKIQGGAAKDLPSYYKDTNPWLAKVDPESQVHSIYEASQTGNDLGLDHLTDELRNALNPESGLPRHLQLTPEQMQQMGMEKAVRHVHAINEWRAAQKVEANAKLAGDHPAVSKVREYAENNPKGLRWVEIKPTGNLDLPEGYTVEPNSTYLGKTGYQLRTPDGSRLGLPQETEELAFAELKDPRYKVDKALQEQLKYEGDTMGHCVGGYCDDVASGASRIFSLRDAKGEPHVTIEVAPSESRKDIMSYLFEQHHGNQPRDLDELNDFITTKRARYGDLPLNEADWNTDVSNLSDIVQIKGKQNRKPNDEYLPFVQDFVKNHPEGGQWGEIGDLENTGLRSTRDIWNDMEQQKIRDAGFDIPSYITQDEVSQIVDKVWPPKNYAEGGLITSHENWQPVEANGVMGYLLR